MSGRRKPEGVNAWLAKSGFSDPASTSRLLAQSELQPVVSRPEIMEAIAQVPDPDLAVRGLSRLLPVLTPTDHADFVDILHHDTIIRRRLLHVLGFSEALVDHCVRHKTHWRDVTMLDPDIRPDAAQLQEALVEAVADGTDEELDSLRIAYRRHLLSLAALDLSGELDVSAVAAELSDLAGAVLEAALVIARRLLPPDASSCRLAIIGMGKCGGNELNYASDVDVLFVAEPVSGENNDGWLREATALASQVMRVCSQHTTHGTIWPVDVGLRPEGRNGLLVRTLDSYLTYYKDWAKTWEFQALLKARPIAGDSALGEAFVEAVEPMVWEASSRPDFVDDVRNMRLRVEASIRPRDADRQLKLGKGGLRDVEFAVQLLQLVHGRTDESVRSRSTLGALRSLIDGGYVGREDGATLTHAYRFLRTLEHRIQLRKLRRTHLLPISEDVLRTLARSLSLTGAQDVTKALQQHAQHVRRLHEKLFYRPLLSAVARLGKDEARLSPDAAKDRLAALGYADPAGAMRNLEALTAGVSRRAAIQRTLLPVFLGWFADTPLPDRGLSNFRAVSEALENTHWYLRLLRDDQAAASRLVRVLGSGRYATELLLRSPSSVSMLSKDTRLRPSSREALAAEVLTGATRHDDPTASIGVVRAMRRRELFRVSAADLVEGLPIDEVTDALTAISHVTVEGALYVATASVEATMGMSLPTRFAVVAMGRLGGQEMGYGSDADVLFIHQPLPDADPDEADDAARMVAHEMSRLLSLPSPEPPFTLDAGLRPEGKQGPLVRTLEAYAAYYERWGDVWERQALLRAAPCCGDAELLTKFEEIIATYRWPEEGLTDKQVREIRRMKARVESDRLPRGIDPYAHVKLGPGGLADVEWTVQLIQLRHAYEIPDLCTTSTLKALDAAVKAGLVTSNDGEALTSAWRKASQIRNAIVLVAGRPADVLPKDPHTLAAVSRLMGYQPAQTAMFIDDYRRTMRKARTVMTRVFYGES